MKHILLALMLLGAGALCAEDFSQHVFFKHLIGKWEAKGDLVNDKGEPVKLVEDWEAKATAEGGLVITGRRELNESKQTFKWTITRNPATDTLEVLHVVDGDEGNAMHFEGHVSEVNLTLELRAQIGSNGSVTLVDSFADDAKDTINSEVTLTGDDGKVTLSGKITHKRVKP